MVLHFFPAIHIFLCAEDVWKMDIIQFYNDTSKFVRKLLIRLEYDPFNFADFPITFPNCCFLCIILIEKTGACLLYGTHAHMKNQFHHVCCFFLAFWASFKNVST